MCKVKFGHEITSDSDLQNLIIGIIFRQEKKYLEKDIYKETKKHVENASIPISDQKLQETVKYHLDKLTRFRKVYRLDGVYTPLGIRIY